METEIALGRMATNQTQSAWPLRKPQQLVYVELGPYNGGMLLGICEFGFSFRAVAPLKSDAPINFTFALDGKNRLQGAGEIAWTEDDGKTGGLKFTNVSPQFRESLRAWLADDALPKNSGREHTPAAALALDSLDKIKSTIREGRAEAIKASVPRVEERVEENVVEAKGMPPPGFHIDEQLPEEWSEKDVAKLKSGKSPETSEEPRAPSKPAIKKMLPPGFYIDEQLPEEWSEKDLAKLKFGESSDPEPKPAPVPPVFQKPIVPSPPERPPLATVRPEPIRTAAPSSSESTFALSGFRLPSASSSPPAEPAVIRPTPRPPEPAPTVEAIRFPLEIPPPSRPRVDDVPPPAIARRSSAEDLRVESPRLNRAAAAGIISLALAVILVALVLSFRREVGETLIRLGRQLAGEQQLLPASPAQNPASPAASPVRNDPAPTSLPASNPSPSSSDQPPASTAQSQPATSPTQTPEVTAQSTPDRASTIRQIEDLPAPEDGGSGQKEFDQAKTILKGIHRQRDIQMAVALLWTGVRKGYVPAEVTLADLYARGDGVQRNCEQARVLLKAAIQKGSPEGRRRLALLRQQGCPGS